MAAGLEDMVAPATQQVEAGVLWRTPRPLVGAEERPEATAEQLRERICQLKEDIAALYEETEQLREGCRAFKDTIRVLLRGA